VFEEGCIVESAAVAEEEEEEEEEEDDRVGASVANSVLWLCVRSYYKREAKRREKRRREKRVFLLVLWCLSWNPLLICPLKGEIQMKRTCE